MRLAAATLFALLCLSLDSAYYITQTRDQLLDYYFSHVDDKIPKSARMLIGDERINVYVGGQAVGVETRRGQLYSFEMYALEKPSIVVRVSDDAAEKITGRKMGIIQAIDTGGIKIEPKNLFSAFKVEMMKRIYAVSGADDKLLGRGSTPLPPFTAGAMYAIRKARIEG